MLRLTDTPHNKRSSRLVARWRRIAFERHEGEENRGVYRFRLSWIERKIVTRLAPHVAFDSQSPVRGSRGRSVVPVQYASRRAAAIADDAAT